MNLNTNMAMLGKRNPWEGSYTVGIDASGKLLAIELQYYIDCGCCINDSVGNMQAAMMTCDNAYYCPNWLVTPVFVKTDTPSNTWARGPGCCPAVFVMETIIEHVASFLGLPAMDVRFTNLYQQGQMTPYGSTVTYCSLSSLWTSYVGSASFQQRILDVDAFNKENRWRKQGLSVAPNKSAKHGDVRYLTLNRYPITYQSGFFGATMSVTAVDGSVNISIAVC